MTSAERATLHRLIDTARRAHALADGEPRDSPHAGEHPVTDARRNAASGLAYAQRGTIPTGGSRSLRHAARGPCGDDAILQTRARPAP